MFYRNFITLRPFHSQGPLELYNFLQPEVHAHVDTHVTTPHIFILPRLVRNSTTKKQSESPSLHEDKANDENNHNLNQK